MAGDKGLTKIVEKIKKDFPLEPLTQPTMSPKTKGG